MTRRIALDGVIRIGALCFAIAGVVVAPPAAAMQNLIPAPYPNTAPGVAPLNPEMPEPGAPQRLMKDPYPQLQGDNAQGNPSIARLHRHQHLVPSIYQRKYRVDRP